MYECSCEGCFIDHIMVFSGQATLRLLLFMSCCGSDGLQLLVFIFYIILINTISYLHNGDYNYKQWTLMISKVQPPTWNGLCIEMLSVKEFVDCSMCSEQVLEKEKKRSRQEDSGSEDEAETTLSQSQSQSTPRTQRKRYTHTHTHTGISYCF